MKRMLDRDEDGVLTGDELEIFPNESVFKANFENGSWDPNDAEWAAYIWEDLNFDEHSDCITL